MRSVAREREKVGSLGIKRVYSTTIYLSEIVSARSWHLMPTRIQLDLWSRSESLQDRGSGDGTERVQRRRASQSRVSVETLGR